MSETEEQTKSTEKEVVKKETKQKPETAKQVREQMRKDIDRLGEELDKVQKLLVSAKGKEVRQDDYAESTSNWLTIDKLSDSYGTYQAISIGGSNDSGCMVRRVYQGEVVGEWAFEKARLDNEGGGFGSMRIIGG